MRTADLTFDRVAREPPAELQQRRKALAHRLRPDRRPPVEDRGGAAQGATERLVIRVPPGVAHSARLPHAQLDVDALIQPELRVRTPQAGLLDATPGALT